MGIGIQIESLHALLSNDIWNTYCLQYNYYQDIFCVYIHFSSWV